MTLEEKVDRVEKKLDLLLTCFGLDGSGRESLGEIQVWAKNEVSKFYKRKKLKSSSEMGKVLQISGEEAKKG